MINKIYESPTMEIVKAQIEDIVRTSPVHTEGAVADPWYEDGYFAD